MCGIINLQVDQAAWQQAFFDFLEEQPVDEGDAPPRDKEQIETQFSFVDIDQFDHALFHESLRSKHREKIVDVAKRILKEQVPEIEECDDLSVAFTGSDGREEKLSPYSSPMELMIVVKTTTPRALEIVEKIQSVASKNPELFDRDVEFKALDSDALMTYNRNVDLAGPKDEHPFPTRSFDAQYLAGSQQLYGEYKKAFFAEVQDPANRSVLTEFKKQTVKKCVQLLARTMDASDASHIDLKTGDVHYNGKLVKGVKYPFLRVIQYKLAMHVFRLMQTKKVQQDDFLNMPFSTIDRIQWLADRKLIQASSKEVADFKKAYIASLIWLGISQKNFEIFHESTSVFSAEEMGQAAQAIAKFCEKVAD